MDDVDDDGDVEKVTHTDVTASPEKLKGPRNAAYRQLLEAEMAAEAAKAAATAPLSTAGCNPIASLSLQSTDCLHVNATRAGPRVQ